MKFIKPCKGKDISNVPKSKLLQDGWYASIKYDGNYVQIQKEGDKVKFFTSGGKEFYLPRVANHLINVTKKDDFVLHCEYMYDCEGKLGDRVHSSKLTTYRTDFMKGVEPSDDTRDILRVFDCSYLRDTRTQKTQIDDDTIYANRERHLGLWIWSVEPIMYQANGVLRNRRLSECQTQAEQVHYLGWEGLFLTHKDHTFRSGKRVNDAIKLKHRPTADLICKGVMSGEGKYEGLIGSLYLMDGEGRDVYVGSGLSDEDRYRDPEYFLDKIIEIEYEQILETYIQPTYKHIREDK